MLNPLTVQVLLGIIFFTMFFEGLGVQLNKYLKKKGIKNVGSCLSAN
jgi:hypothetical protein